MIIDNTDAEYTFIPGMLGFDSILFIYQQYLTSDRYKHMYFNLHIFRSSQSPFSLFL